jgi:hypothetical protein
MMVFHNNDNPASILLFAADLDVESLIDFAYPKVFRTDFAHPGFAVLDFGKNVSSEALREKMIQIKKGFNDHLVRERRKQLIYHWLGRFDQQESTIFHRDNAPDQSILMLGYEPTKVKSKLFLGDYLQLIDGLQLSIGQYYDQYNPMIAENEDLLQPYITEVKNFGEDTFKIVILNNSDSIHPEATKGLFHKATMVSPDPHESRIVNSVMLAFADLDYVENSFEQEQEFISTNHVSKS